MPAVSRPSATRADAHDRPSHVFVKRLREVRERRNLSQTQLARLMTDAGRPLSKVALLRIETGKRGLSLDEALALAALLPVAPAHLLSPPDDAMVWPTDNLGFDGSAMRNWLLFGDPLLLTPTGQRAKLRIGFTHAIEVYAQAIVDAKNGHDSEGQKHATDALYRTIVEHQAAMRRIGDDEPTEG
jgi:transcriptional regulator with XRE-family HTH domain